MQIVSSSAPCGDFYFLSCWSSDSKRREAAAAAAASRTLFSSKRQSSAAAAAETTSDLTHLLKTCSELDLNIIVIWKVGVVEKRDEILKLFLKFLSDGCGSVQAYVIEDNVQVVLQGQLHVAMQSIGEEAISLTPKEVPYTRVHHEKNTPSFKSLHFPDQTDISSSRQRGAL